MKLRLLPLILALLFFAHEAALGKTVQLDQANVQLDVPDDFVPADLHLSNGFYSAVRYKDGSRMTISVTGVVGQTENIEDPAVLNTAKTALTNAGYNILSCEVKDIGGSKYLVSEIQNETTSEAHFKISDQNEEIIVTFKKTPPIPGPVAEDPMVMSVMNSFTFLQQPQAAPPTSSSTNSGGGFLSRGTTINLYTGIIVMLIIMRLMRLARMINRF